MPKCGAKSHRAPGNHRMKVSMEGHHRASFPSLPSRPRVKPRCEGDGVTPSRYAIQVKVFSWRPDGDVVTRRHDGSVITAHGGDIIRRPARAVGIAIARNGALSSLTLKKLCGCKPSISDAAAVGDLRAIAVNLPRLAACLAQCAGWVVLDRRRRINNPDGSALDATAALAGSGDGRRSQPSSRQVVMMWPSGWARCASAIFVFTSLERLSDSRCGDGFHTSSGHRRGRWQDQFGGAAAAGASGVCTRFNRGDIEDDEGLPRYNEVQIVSLIGDVKS